MRNQRLDQPTTSRRSLFSTACHRVKYLPKIAIILASMLVFVAAEVRADGWTITITDNGGAPIPPSVSISGGSSASVITFANCASEGCTIVDAPNHGFSPTFVPPDFLIAEPGPNPVASDWFQFIVDPSTNDVIIAFHNTNTTNGSGRSVCCQATEGGTIQIAGPTWGDPVTDTIVFESSPSATPEPASLFLLGTGLLGIGGAIRRKFRV